MCVASESWLDKFCKFLLLTVALTQKTSGFFNAFSKIFFSYSLHSMLYVSPGSIPSYYNIIDCILYAVLYKTSSGLVRSAFARIGLKRHKAYMLTELRIPVGCCSGWQGQATEIVRYDEMREANSPWRERHLGSSDQVNAPSRTSGSPCFAFGGLRACPVGVNSSFCSVQTSAGCV